MQALMLWKTQLKPLSTGTQFWRWKIRECHIFIRQISKCLSLTMLEWKAANHCWRTHTAVLQRLWVCQSQEEKQTAEERGRRRRGGDGMWQINKIQILKCIYRLTNTVIKSITRGAETGAIQEIKERKICKRCEGGPSLCFRLESWPKWSWEPERERQSETLQRHMSTTMDARCEREKPSDEKGEAEWREEGGGKDKKYMQNTLTRKETSKWSSCGISLLQTFVSRWD